MAAQNIKKDIDNYHSKYKGRHIKYFVFCFHWLDEKQ